MQQVAHLAFRLRELALVVLLEEMRPVPNGDHDLLDILEGEMQRRDVVEGKVIQSAGRTRHEFALCAACCAVRQRRLDVDFLHTLPIFSSMLQLPALSSARRFIKHVLARAVVTAS